MDSLTSWLQNSWLYEFIAENNYWVWPALETFHFFGMCLLFGALLVMDLRLMGWERLSAVTDTDNVARVALAGFLINLITGVLFCFGDPGRYFINISFQLKIVAIFLAALNFAYYKRKLSPLVVDIGPGQDTPGIAKLSAAASLILWIGVLSFGRLIPYLE